MIIIIIIIIIIHHVSLHTPTKYVKRQDGVAKVIHQKLAEGAELIENRSLHYKYTHSHYT